MDLYLSSLLLGAAGLGVMALSGLGAHGHDASSLGHSHAGAHGGGSHAGHAHSVATHPVHAPGARGTNASSTGVSRTLWAIMSPRLLFSFLLGMGTAGLLARPFLGGPVLLATAIAGGIVFERVVVAPMWNFLMRFASTPASTLESAVSDEATAVTSFDANGQGIVSLEVDGQIVQILATLRPDDRLLGGARIRAGQRVRVEEVDSEQNRCTISII